jgi:putative phage-type endonuclease
MRWTVAELVCGTGDRDTWLAARRAGITATDLPVILGLVTWNSPFALYWQKKGVLPEVEQSDRMRLGSWLEQEIARQWFGGRPGLLIESGLYRSSVRSWQLATPDRLLTPHGDPATATAVLECKTWGTKDGWGESDYQAKDVDEFRAKRNQVPASVRAQVLWQMDTLGVATGHVAVVFLPSGEFRSYTIEHHPAHFTPNDEPLVDECPVCRDIKLMRDRAFLFLANHLTNSSPPPVDGLAATTDALRDLHAGAVKGKRAEIPVEIWNPWYGAGLEVKRWKEIERENANRVRQVMGDATIGTVDGEPVARREVYKRAAYEMPACVVDRLVRVKPKEDKTDE